MLISAELTFSDEQNVTADANSTNIIDLSATGTALGGPAALVRDIGRGTSVPIVVLFTEDSDGTAETMDVLLQVDTVENFASPTTVQTYTVGSVSAGDRLNIDLPEGVNERYVRLRYEVGGTSPDYTVSAFVVAAHQSGTLGGV